MKFHRRYAGPAIVIVDDHLKHGFVFDHAQIILDYSAESGNPRAKRHMVIELTGFGHMAGAYELANLTGQSVSELPLAVHELEAGVRDDHDSNQEHPKVQDPCQELEP